MRFLREGRSAIPDRRWSELTGPMPLHEVEQFIEHPPEDLGDPGTITVEQHAVGLYKIYRLEERSVA